MAAAGDLELGSTQRYTAWYVGVGVSDVADSDRPGRGIRLAFVGASHWHFLVDARYLDLAGEAGVEIVGLSDDDEAVAQARAEPIGCPWATDPVALVERVKPDFVVALPRPDRAAAQVGALLELGLPL